MNYKKITSNRMVPKKCDTGGTFKNLNVKYRFKDQ